MSIKRAVFDNFETDFAAAEVSEGYNDWFPEDGTYEALITGVVQVDCPFKEKDGTAHDGTLIKFTYRLLTDDEQPDNPRSFEGGPMVFPDCGKAGLKTEGGQIRVDIALKRMKQTLTVTLGDVPSMGAGLMQIEELLGVEEVPVRVRCKSRTGQNGKVYGEETVLERLQES
tara:strand:+ start:988 stop:1500 length:513 start_codon:yes stop_codon:yes gene_type:complete